MEAFLVYHRGLRWALIAAPPRPPRLVCFHNFMLPRWAGWALLGLVGAGWRLFFTDYLYYFIDVWRNFIDIKVYFYLHMSQKSRTFGGRKGEIIEP